MARVALLSFCIAAAACAVRQPPAEVPLELFVRADCPFSLQLEQEVRAVAKATGTEAVTIRHVVPAWSLEAESDAPFVRGALLQLCAQATAPTTGAFLDFVGCQNADWSSAHRDWERCARVASLNADRIRTCADGPVGRDLYLASAARSAEVEARIPTLLIESEPYRGSRTRGGILAAVCERGGGGEACADVPPPVPVSGVLVLHPDCGECGTAYEIDEFKAAFVPGLTVTRGTVEGVPGPALVFDDAVEATAAFPFSRQLLAREAGHWVLHLGPEVAS